VNDKLELLMIRRARDPQKGWWALIGGYLEWDESIEQCAIREVEEEVGIKEKHAQFLKYYDGLDRDKDGRQNIDFCFLVRVHSDEFTYNKEEVLEAKWVSLTNLPENIAFDHRQMVEDYKKTIETPSVGIVVFSKDKKQVVLVKHGEKATHKTGIIGLPAGRPDPGETLVQTAVRELHEETGLETSEKYMRQLPNTYAAVIERKTGYLLFSYAPFICTSYTGEIHQIRETEPFWVDVSKLSDYDVLPNVREAIRDAKEYSV
jgi:ADP-ribose pyrophosphatase YjhB (NUDIX family)